MSAFPGRARRIAAAWAPALLASVGYLVAFAVAMATWSIVNAERSAAAMAQFGKAAAREVAFLAAEPLLRQDRIRLGLLAGRMVERRQIRRIAIHTADEQLFVVVGASAGRGGSLFSEPVAVENVVAGEVRMTLDADAFGLPAQRLLAETWLYWLAGLVLVAGALQGGSLLATRPRPAAGAEDVAPPTATTDQHAGTYLLVASLFRRAGVSADDRKRTLGAALAIAEQVAAEYGGAAAELLGNSLLLAFEPAEGGDRALEVVAAALDLRQRLEANQPASCAATPASFRYCLDAIEQPLGDDPQALAAKPHARAVVLLSSLAPDGEIILCERAYAQLAAPEDLQLATFDNPAAAAVAADATPKGILRGLAAQSA